MLYVGASTFKAQCTVGFMSIGVLRFEIVFLSFLIMCLPLYYDSDSTETPSLRVGRLRPCRKVSYGVAAVLGWWRRGGAGVPLCTRQPSAGSTHPVEISSRPPDPAWRGRA